MLQEFLKTQCVLCGGTFHPALLRDHLIQVHASSLDRLYDILPFLYDAFTRVAHTDYQCAQCHQIFNLPLLGDPPWLNSTPGRHWFWLISNSAR